MNMRNRLIVEVMLNCALRNSELRQLNIDSINPNTGEFTVIQKVAVIKIAYYLVKHYNYTMST